MGRISRFGKRLAAVAFLGALLLVPCYSQTSAGAKAPYTNDSILKLAKAGVGVDVMIALVKAQPANYAFDLKSLNVLRQAGVPERVLTAMWTQAGGAAGATLPGAPGRGGPASMTPGTDGPNENGVYRPGARIGMAVVQRPRLTYPGTQHPVVWAGKNVCGGSIRATYVVGTDGRAVNLSVVEAVHFVDDKGHIESVDGADAGQLKSLSDSLHEQGFQPGLLDGKPVAVQVETSVSQSCRQ